MKKKSILNILPVILLLMVSFSFAQQRETQPVEFNKIKEARYAKVIVNLKDIRSAELAYQELNGNFTGSFDSLVRFIDTAEYAIIERRDTSYADVEKNRAYNLGDDGGYYIEDIIIDTLGFSSVKDSLFGKTDRYKTMMNIPLEVAEGAKYELQAGKYEKNGDFYSVFEARVAKKIILSDQNKDLLYQEEDLVSVDGINGPYVKVGAMDDIESPQIVVRENAFLRATNVPILKDGIKRLVL